MGKKTWTNEDISLLKENYGKIKTEELAKLLNKKTQSIRLKAHKLKIKGNRKLAAKIYSFNDNFFDKPNIDNCYWAGWIASDGNISKDKDRIKLSITNRDKEVLLAFKNQINFDGPITTFATNTKNYKYNSKYYSMCKIVLHSHNIILNLNKHFNITPAKSLTLQPPKDYICGDLALAYIIGLFDGDGHISVSNKKKFSIGFLGTQTLMEWVKLHLVKLAPISKKESLVKKRKDNNCYMLRYYGKRAKCIHDKLKQISINFRLARKWQPKEYWKNRNLKENRELKEVTS